MKGDFSRLRFSPNKNYTSVLQQQGRVALDADANEQCAIDEHLRTTETIDVVGKVGGPIHDEGFAITVDNDAIEIGKGRYYVEGILCENERPVAYAEQQFLIDPSPTDQALLNSLQQGTIGAIQVYLQVWKRLVTALDDGCLREPAIGQADTTARLQTVWRVLAHGVQLTLSAPIAGTVMLQAGSAVVTGIETSFTSALEVGQQLVFGSDSAQTPYTISAIGNDTSLTLATAYAGPSTTNSPTTASVVSTAAGSCCKSMHTGLVPVRDPGKMRADTGDSSGECSCQPTPPAGYHGLENQLYRVEIHRAGTEAAATFKWSRDNGSVVVAVTSTSGNQVYVDSLGPDPNLGFAVGQWVEISDDSNLFGQDPHPGDLYQIQSVSPESLCVTMTQPVAWVDPTRNARMRRWDQFGSAAGADAVSLSTTPLALENGIEVEFRPGNYESGDYWLIPARTATGQIEWPPCNSDGNQFQAAHHTDIFLAPLACIQWNSQTGQAQVHDCRKPFHPLTELTPTCASTCCTYSVGDGVESFGDFTSIQSAIDALPDAGGEVCILKGRYYENVRIVNRRDIVIHGCCWQTRVASASLQANAQAVRLDTVGAVNPVVAVFAIVGSQHVELRSFAVEAADDEAGILIDGYESSLSTSQKAELARLRVLSLGVIDVTIEDMTLTAATLPAILALRVQLLRIDRNRVAMKNVRSLWPAIYTSGIEIHIDQNWVGIQSAANIRRWLPYTVSEDLSGATATTAPSVSAGAEAAAGSDTTREFIGALGTTLTSVDLVLHPGGIQIGGPSTDVYVVENEIEGGSRNGITLGSLDVLDPNGGSTGFWTGTSTTTESGDCNCTGTLQTSSTDSGKPGYTLVAGGILTDIRIHRNRIRNMGLCGIGPVAFFDLSQTLEIITTVNLEISANDISRTLLRVLSSTDSKTSVGYGAICIPDVQYLMVRDNTITDFGAQPGTEVCGIFILHGEAIDISRNRVLETRDWTSASEEKTVAGISRGGIVILLGTPPTFSQPVDTSLWVNRDAFVADATSAPIYEPGLPAVRVEHNEVRVPLAYTLAILGLGPFAIVNNHLACGGLVHAKRVTLAQTVLILNLGTSIEIAKTAMLPSATYAQANSTAGMSIAASLHFSCGTVHFANNICQLEASASRQREAASVVIFTPDHLIFSNNHCWIDGAVLSAIFDALLVAGSLNVVGNRFQEKVGTALFSGLTAGVANVTCDNISTNCLIALGPWLKNSNNISFINQLAPEFCSRLWKDVVAALGQ